MSDTLLHVCPCFLLNVCFVVIYDLVCLTDGSESASQHSSESLQQEPRDQEDGGETSTKEEDKHSFMDFPVREIAEQLTRLDSVGLNNKYLKADFHVTAGSLIHIVFPCHCLSLRICLSEWCPSTAWAASGPSVTRKKIETWHPPSEPPSPSSTLSPTVSSPRSSARPRPVLQLPLPSHRLSPPLASCTPPLPRAHPAARTPAPPKEHAS